jgi:NADH:ubiquinone oxidoreductase subunit F (NADH-binding)
MTAPPTTRGLLDVPGPALADHLAVRGPLPAGDGATLAARAALTGRGGAAFPTAGKLRAVAAEAAATGRAAVVVGNGAEGEPAAAKDRVLLIREPHLVLDGLQLVARSLGATDVVLAADAALLPGLAGALAERRGELPVRLHGAARTFLAGERSALVAALDGGPALPRAKEPPVRRRGVAGRPTLVLNVETLARLALVARGDDGAAARTLVTRHEERHGAPVQEVLEVTAGARLDDVLVLDQRVQAVLVGGYHGTWLPVAVARGVRLSGDGLAAVGASLGAGVLAALPADRCGIRETARVVGHLARESAGQCGPCFNGLPRIAAALELLARPGPPAPALVGDVARWCGLVTGRGACHHPDGTVRLVASALQVFGAELDAHQQRTCTAPSDRPFLPVPGGVR